MNAARLGIGLRALAGVIALSMLFGCSGPTSGVPGVESVTIVQGDQQLVVGESVALDADVVTHGGASSDVAWSSDAPAGASVDDAGVVTAASAGTAAVTATSTEDPTASDRVAVTVADPGAVLETLQFGSSAYEYGSGAASDDSGHVYVLFSTDGDIEGASAGQYDVVLRKYDAAQSIVWTRQFGTADYETVGDVTTDVSGNVLVAGSTQGGLDGSNVGLYDAFLRKYDPDGHTVWTRQLGSTSGDFSHAVAADAAGNIFIAGSTDGAIEGSHAGSRDAWIRKYDPDGNAIWTRQFGTAGSDIIEGVTIDSSGDIYVAGYTGGDIDGTNAGRYDMLVRKYDPDGNVLWTRQSGTTELDAATAATIDGAGNVVITGFTDGDLEGVHAGGRDVFVRKYDPDGAVVWTRQLGTVDRDYAQGVATDGAGNILVAGYSEGDVEGVNAGGLDGFLRKYSTDGNVVWTRQFGTSANDVATGVAIGLDGHAWVVGDTEGALVGSNLGFTDIFLRVYGR